MNKKAILSIIVVILLALFLFIANSTDQKTTSEDLPTQTETEPETVTESVAPFIRLKNAEILAPESDHKVKLVDGKGSYELNSGPASSRGEVIVIDGFSTLWSTQSGKTDLTAILISNEGGSGTFYYLVLFDVQGDIFTKKSEVFLGDRINVTRMNLGELVHDINADYRITLESLERKDGEPFTAKPTVVSNRTFYVTNQILKELEIVRDDT